MVRPKQSTHNKNSQLSATRATRARVSAAPITVGRLAGKVALVTGGSRGIGFAIARALASEQCNVIITGRNSESLEQAADVLRRQFAADDAHFQAAQIVPLQCDVRDPDAVEQTFREFRRSFKQLDILVNNAGVSQPVLPIEQTTIDLWREMIDTNLTGTFLCSKAALPLMQAGATIINILSAAAKTPFPNFAAYNSSKHGALGLTLTLREELKERNIRVCAFVPGATDTAIWQQIMPDVPRERLMDAETIGTFVIETVLLSAKANLTELVLDPMAGAI